ncbi:hypothetical protein JK358_12430 [Nocardia sp. 2]|uniref:Uncharacterized protein n=1 Tax=Nocardia acididurans TaxID=2802282 RepID=A0ABS1M4S1_9NOCA|nr:hypothetical protein [Nocardia acididurans]MBL1075199.1 hypothetical protein [Nocardia acididurans]
MTIGLDMSGEQSTVSELKPVGIYREMYRKPRTDLPSLRDSYTDATIEDRDLVAQYMNSATPIFDVAADVTDLLNPAQSIPSGPSLLSDGEWIWRADSVHYLANYPLTIPPQFLTHVRANAYRPAPGVDVANPLFDDAITAYF